MVDQIIESFKRLYKNGKINEDTLNTLLEKGVIVQSDKEYIMQKEGD